MTETVSGPSTTSSTRGARNASSELPLTSYGVEVAPPTRAIVPPAKRLSVERVYTTPGVHPYDEVTWERRDIVMTNWRDGSINFEQRGVEFPSSWSINASNIVTTKYFRGAVGTPQREWSLKQLIDRVVTAYVVAGKKFEYFATETDADVFGLELTHSLLHQVFSFNSPVWFNVGTTAPQQVSACFILAVDDTMDSILNWYREEGLIFKGGSGAGLNLSRIRSAKELLSSGGTASGPVSFMRGADASAGTIKSGGATRRAAKMVVLDVDHPDIEEFIETKSREEDKIRALRDAGYDMDLGGRDIVSVQYQNANNSVRVNAEFMRAVEDGKPFGLRGRMDGEVLETVDARELMRKITTAAWECADPGIQYDDIINDWHTTPETGRITASNPCFPADQRVVTDKGLVAIGELVSRAVEGEVFDVYTNDVTAEKSPRAAVVVTTPTRYMVTGRNEIVELRFSDGSRLRCTPNHRVWTESGWVRAQNLTEGDHVVRSFHYAGRPFASSSLPAQALVAARSAAGPKLAALPEKWSPELAHYLGWMLGDGCVTEAGAVTVYGNDIEAETFMPRHQALLASITGFDSKPSHQGNGTYQLRSMREGLRRFLLGLGFSSERAAGKTLPHAVLEAPEDALSAFLRGLFDADGCVVNQAVKGTRYVGLGSRSDALLRDVQEVLASLGIAARIYETGTKTSSFDYVRKNGEHVTYGSDGPGFDLRISGRSIESFSELVGFDHPEKKAKLESVLRDHTFSAVDETVRLVGRESQGYETTYNLTEPRNHSYIVSGVVVANCSEYMSLDNSSCNLASLNLLKFLRTDGTFDAPLFAKTVELIITAMEISISFADFPTEAIGVTTRAYRQLGIGYANLGALLMATGHAYDSEGGRALAASITSLMTATAYKRSAEVAGVVGPYAGFSRNADSHTRVMRKHAAANDAVRAIGADDARILHEASKAWAACLKYGEKNGWRNAQASVLAPTGCLTADTMVTTSRGLTRLGELGELYGTRWQDLDVRVSTDDGEQQATKFFVNGEEPTRRIITEGGYRLQGTLAHRIKVVDQTTGDWVWKRLADIATGDVVPVQLGTLVGESRTVALPVLDDAYWTADPTLEVPTALDADLAELAGYVMGNGSLHAKGLRFCVADTDLDIVERFRILAKGLFNLEPTVTQQQGYQEVAFTSVRLARWWQAAGLAKTLPHEGHTGMGWQPRIPSAVLETNDREIYAAFVRGLFEADGAVSLGVPNLSTASRTFASELQTLLLTIGFATTLRETVSGSGGAQFQVRLRDRTWVHRYAEEIGFLSNRKASALVPEVAQRGSRDRVQLPAAVWERLVPLGHQHRDRVVADLRKHGGVARDLAAEIQARTPDAVLAHSLGYLFERVQLNEDGGVQPTYDLSVPSNVTYVANGLVSHNTIGFMMDCDTTGIEPDFSLVKSKKLVGGGSMTIVNATVTPALRSLGYTEETVEAIVEFIGQHGHVVDAPGLRPEHYEVFDCAVGERAITGMGHVRMMAAVQPFISGAISKTVNLPETATVEDIEHVYIQGWKLGLKALAIYRDNCKVGQPLSSGGTATKDVGSTAAVVVVEKAPSRERLPRHRASMTYSFSVAGAEGYLTASKYENGRLGEVFIKMSKQGSTLAGVMDAFSVSISIGLQYGVPLEAFVSKYTNMRFDPAGMTDDADIRIASSVMDYLFRRLALDYLPFDKRAELGIYSAEERARSIETGSYEPVAQDSLDIDIEGFASGIAVGDISPKAVPVEPAVEVLSLTDGAGVGEAYSLSTAVDAPLCFTCGVKMRPAGSCYVCESCGSTSGCS